ncbi:MAG: isopenicillin N synthase family dioxygenase [Frankia sp.]
MTLVDVPIIDIGPYRRGDAEQRQAVAAKIGQACREIGFLVIDGHGVSPRLLEATRRASREFFDLPLSQKAAMSRPGPAILRGYVGVEGESVGRSRDALASAGDLNESMMIGPVDTPPAEYAYATDAGHHFAPNLWPSAPADFRAVWTDYYQAMSELAGTLMRAFALALEQPEDYFDSKINRHISRLRVRNYPSIETPPQPGQVRAGAHTDYGTLTILATEDRPGGLQVCNGQGDWVDVPIIPGCFIVNIGDLMARWTNDTWISTLHRVINPPAHLAASSRRQSLIFFHNPNYDAVVDCIPSCLEAGAEPKYEPTTSGRHLREQFTKTQNIY